MSKRFQISLVVISCVLFSMFTGTLFANVNLSYDSYRHAFLRSEDVVIKVSINNQGKDEIDGPILKMSIDDILAQEIKAAKIRPNDSMPALFRFKASNLKAGHYHLQCEMTSKDDITASKKFPIVIVNDWNTDRMRVWVWPHEKFGRKTYRLNSETKRQLAWYSDKGFNCFHPGGGITWDSDIGTVDERAEVIEYALCNQWDVTFKLHSSFHIDCNDPKIKFPVPGYGTNTMWCNPHHIKAIRIQNTLNKQKLQWISQFPNVFGCFLESEYEDYVPNDFPHAKEKYEWPLRETNHQFIKRGVIKDTDGPYHRHLYKFRWGDGILASNLRASRLAHRYLPDIMVFADPLRQAAIYERFKGIDAFSTWTYTNPDPKYMLYIETLIAAAAPFKQDVIHTVTLYNYPGTVFPRKIGDSIMGPDRLVETSWINLSRRPAALSVYFNSACDPFDPNLKEPYQHYLPTMEAFKKFNNLVVKPYGPMIKKLERRNRKVAILSSDSSRFYSASPVLLGSYNNYQIYSFYTLLNMLHVPVDVIFDETVIEYGIDKYDVLVMPKCDTLLKTVYDRILAFQKRGGIIVADQYLRADIPEVIRFNFDFTYRKNVSADALASGQTYAKWDDHVKIDFAVLADVNGITALQDQKIMENYAEKLATGLNGKLPVDIICSSPTALINTLERDQVLYLFVINDKRTYDSRTGPYKAILEKAVPQTVTVKMMRWPHKSISAYDIIERKILSVDCKDNYYSFDVDLPAPGGKLIIIRPDQVNRIRVAVPGSFSRGKTQDITVMIHDEKGNFIKGVEPVKIDITDPNGLSADGSDFYAVENGFLKLQFTPALNDKLGKWKVSVEDLAVGISCTAEFELKNK